jgi:predicted nucleotidyltransferase
MSRNEVVASLRSHGDAIRAFGITALYLYGSGAPDALAPGSDVDLFADVDYGRFGFLPFMNLREFLEQVLGRKVDFTTRNALHPDLKDDIVRSAITVFDEAAVDPVAAEPLQSVRYIHRLGTAGPKPAFS